MTGTFGMAMAEVMLRATKAALVVWATRRRSRVLEGKLQQITLERSRRNTGAAPGRVSSFLPSPESVKLEYELWKKQMLSYHTAEYAEYIAIGCSQSIVFWWFGHPLYPTLQRAVMSEIDVARWRFNQVVMLGFQSFVEVFVDWGWRWRRASSSTGSKISVHSSVHDGGSRQHQHLERSLSRLGNDFVSLGR